MSIVKICFALSLVVKTEVACTKPASLLACCPILAPAPRHRLAGVGRVRVNRTRYRWLDVEGSAVRATRHKRVREKQVPAPFLIGQLLYSGSASPIVAEAAASG